MKVEEAGPSEKLEPTTRQHGVTPQSTIILIFTAVRTSNPKCMVEFYIQRGKSSFLSFFIDYFSMLSVAGLYRVERQASWWIRIDLGRSGRGLIVVPSQNLSRNTEVNRDKLQLWQPVSRPRFEPRTSRTRISLHHLLSMRRRGTR
jgi:hypothetical protein